MSKVKNEYILAITFEDFINLAGSFSSRITKTEGADNSEVIHPLTYYESDGILYLYRAFADVVYGTKVIPPMSQIEQDMGFENFRIEHLAKAIHLTENY